MGTFSKGMKRGRVNKDLHSWTRRTTAENRKKATPAEWALFEAIRRKDGKYPAIHRFKRQVAFSIYETVFIADFFCHQLGLIVELDGPYHDTEKQREKDRRRGLLLLAVPKVNQIRRYSNDQVLTDVASVVADLRRWHPRIATEWVDRRAHKDSARESDALWKHLLRLERQKRNKALPDSH